MDELVSYVKSYDKWVIIFEMLFWILTACPDCLYSQGETTGEAYVCSPLPGETGFEY